MMTKLRRGHFFREKICRLSATWRVMDTVKPWLVWQVGVKPVKNDVTVACRHRRSLDEIIPRPGTKHFCLSVSLYSLVLFCSLPLIPSSLGIYFLVFRLFRLNAVLVNAGSCSWTIAALYIPSSYFSRWTLFVTMHCIYIIIWVLNAIWIQERILENICNNK